MRAVEASSRNEAVIQQAQNEVRAAQASIRFLEDELAKLQVGGGGGNGGEFGGMGGPEQGRGSPMRPGEGSRAQSDYQGSPARGGLPPGAGSAYRQGMDNGMGGGRNGPPMTPTKDGFGERPLPPPPPGNGGAPMSDDGPKLKNYTGLGTLANHGILRG